MTLSQLAEKAKLTVSALSQVERGASEPSLSSLRRISEALGAPAFQFLVHEGSTAIVVRKDKRIKVTFPDRDPVWQVVSADTSGDFEVLAVVLKPGSATSQEPGSHASVECSLVLRGRIYMEVGGRTYELEAGDSIKIHRGLPHRMWNASDVEAEMLVVLSPPTF